jgi:hypothetical protein
MDKAQTFFLDTLLARRDKTITTKVQDKVLELNYEIRAMEEQIKHMKSLKTKMSKSLREETFWELNGILGSKEIESLCSVSPKDLQDEIDWNA